MPVATAVGGSYFPSKFCRSLPYFTGLAKRTATPPTPIFISTNPRHVDLYHLRDLFAACNHSCHRFPTLDTNGRVEPVDILKLRTALSHSSVVVSVFTKPEFVVAQSPESGYPVGTGGDWISRAALVNPENGRLIGFGRAVSDLGLTASIYDVMVHPQLQGRGIGRMILKRIVRMLTYGDVYDISALCTNKERLFFSACEFRDDDEMGSVTMMYARSASSYSEDNKMICFGRKKLLVPPLRENL